MTTLFASLGLSTLTIIVLAIELLSLAVLCIGLLAYRHIIRSHRMFFSVLHHEDKQTREPFVHVIFWLYLVSTLLLILLTSALYVRHASFL